MSIGPQNCCKAHNKFKKREFKKCLEGRHSTNKVDFVQIMLVQEKPPTIGSTQRSLKT